MRLTDPIDGVITRKEQGTTAGGKPFWRFDLTRQEPGGRDKPDVERVYPMSFWHSDMPDIGDRVECEVSLSSYRNKAGFVNLQLTAERIVCKSRKPMATAAAPALQPPQDPQPQPQLPADDIPFMAWVARWHRNIFAEVTA